MSRRTYRMVPDESANISIRQQGADGGQAGLQCQFRPPTEVEHTLFGISRWRFGMDERPTAVENSSSEFRRNVECREISRAECRYKQDELQIRHSGILDIQRWHSRALSMATGTESTGTMLPKPANISRVKMRSVRP